MSFTHLRVHTTYSLAEGAIKIDPLIDRVKENNMSAVAMTDTCNLFGAMEFSQKAAKAGIQPIIGTQLNLACAKDDPRQQQNQKGPSRILTDQVLLYAQNHQGYLNLMRLVSSSWQNAKNTGTNHITFDELGIDTQGLIALTGGHQGGIGRLLVEKQKDAANTYLSHLDELFKNRLYMELSRTDRAEQGLIEEDLINFAYDSNIPLVATNEVFFLDKNMHEAHDALLCIADGVVLGQGERRRENDCNRFCTSDEMEDLFQDIPEAIESTHAITQRCGFMVETHDPILPRFPSEKTEVEELREQAKNGLQKRLDLQVYTPNMSDEDKAKVDKEYFDRLEMELGVIINMGFPGYFLIVADFIQWAKNNNIPVGPGRGSGAGSLVAWALTITDIDPIRFQLIFERFLNPERVSMPDFDVDFCQDRRDEVIAYVTQKYGADKVAQIITFGKMQARAVLRDVGRVLQMPLGLVDRLCKMIPNNPAIPTTLQEALDQDADLRKMVKGDAAVGHLFNIAMKLEGLYRHASTHAAGVVIGDRPLQELVPLYCDPRSDTPATQYNMKDVEKAGLVKFDFLGLKTLTVLQRTMDQINARGANIILQKIPLDDKPTFELLNRLETVGIFQLESAGMVDVLKRLKPSRFEELIALVALYRPGPMDDIPRYLACKHGTEEVSFLHPLLEPILEETFGVMVYQEQVMLLAQVLGGYSLGGADLLRRAMGKKIKSEMDAQQKIFIDGAVKNGIEEKVAAQIFEQAAKFASYGFNKSHSAPYALISYQTAYFKANYPLEFMSSVMNLDISATDKLNLYRQELDKMKVPLYPPDVNASMAEFSVERTDKPGIRYGLAAIKNIGEAAMETIVAEREQNGPYKDIWDFVSRVDAKALNKRQFENLIVSGAFDSLQKNRRQLFESVEYLLSLAQSATKERNSSQTSLFGAMPDACAVKSAKLPVVTDWSMSDRLQKEFSAIGFYLTAHPLDGYKSALEKLNVVNCVDFETHFGAEKATAKCAGVILSKKTRTGKTGKKFAFVTFTDSSGVYELMVFGDMLAEHVDLFQTGTSVFLNINGRRDDGNLRLGLDGISALDEKIAAVEQKYTLKIESKDAFAQLKGLLDGLTVGRTFFNYIVTTQDGRSVKLSASRGYSLSPNDYDRLCQLEGIGFVEENKEKATA